MFFRMRDGTLVNTAFIQAVTVITCDKLGDESYSRYGLMHLYSLEEFGEFGFNVDYADKYVQCAEYRAREFVDNDEGHALRLFDNGQGHIKIKGGPLSLVSKYYAWEEGGWRLKNDIHYFLPRENYGDPLAYVVHMSAPTGGMNSDHLKFVLRVDEFERLEKLLDKEDPC